MVEFAFLSEKWSSSLALLATTSEVFFHPP